MGVGMTILFLIGIAGVLFVVNHQQSQGISPAANVGIWILVIVCFAVLLTVASLVGAALPATMVR